jgi:hypothetical protein
VNETSLKDLLNGAPETKASVSDRLHQDIMRSVRLAGPAARGPRHTWALPAFGAAIIVLVWAGLMVFKTSPQPAAQMPAVVQGPSNTGEPAAPLPGLPDSLITRLQQAATPEDRLRQELEHLKSDLERFGFKS